MTLAAIITLIALFLMVRSKQWALSIVCVIAGVFLASTDAGQGVREAITSVSKTVDGWFQS